MESKPDVTGQPGPTVSYSKDCLPKGLPTDRPVPVPYRPEICKNHLKIYGLMKFDDKYGFLQVILKKSTRKRTNLLKLVQFSPIWTNICQNCANMMIKFISKPEGHHYPNKGVNEDFCSK